ncbi:MAG: PfkB family carbohydrate kinase [Chloroflexota bacterium]
MSKVVVVGDFHAALSVHTERLPRPYQSVPGTGLATGGAGRGTVQAVAAARLGAAVTFIGRVGTDIHAQVATQLYQTENINIEFLVRDHSAPTGVNLTFHDPEGKWQSAYAPGANARLTASDVERGQRAIAAADVLVTQLGVPQAAVKRALELAREHNVRSVFKPTPFAPIEPATITLADLVTPNEDELRELALNVNPQDAPQKQITVCTLGAKGAQFFQRQGGQMKTDRVAGFQKRPVDVRGAGDVFSAALAVALAEGQALTDAIRFANAAGALSVTLRGSVAGAPSRAAVDALVATVQKPSVQP